MTEYEKMLGNLPYDYTDEEIQARIVHTYCCDTAYSEDLVPFMRDSSLLCLECTFADDLADLAR